MNLVFQWNWGWGRGKGWGVKHRGRSSACFIGPLNGFRVVFFMFVVVESFNFSLHPGDIFLLCSEENVFSLRPCIFCIGSHHHFYRKKGKKISEEYLS